MLIVDAHQHYWRLQRGDYAWLSHVNGVLYRDFLPADLLPILLSQGLAGTVLVQAAATEEETKFLFELAERHATIAGVVGWVDFGAPDVPERIARLMDLGHGRLKGLRPMVQDLADSNWLARPCLDRAFVALTEAGLAFDALVTPVHFAALNSRLTRQPALRAVLDHGGKPDLRFGESLDAWADAVERLARHPNLYCKLSGLFNLLPVNAPVGELDSVVAHLFACFGAERLMWGSDWPVVTARATYECWLATARDLIHRHAPGSETQVLAANAIEFYRLQIPTSTHEASQ